MDISHKEKRIAHLDGLRGLAILSVVLFHAYSRWNQIEPWQQNEFTKQMFSNGWLGVQLFFIISGFVIFWSLDRCSNLMHFGIKRWLRLFPAMLIASVLIYLSASFIPNRPAGLPDLHDIFPGITFVDPTIWSKVFSLDFRSLDGAFWSLYVETQFYAIAAFSYFILKDRRGVVLSFLFLLYFILVLSGRFLTSHIFAVSAGLEVLRFVGVDYYGWFLVGIFFYRFWKSGGIWNVSASLLFGFLAVACEAASGKGYTAVLLSILLLAVFWLSFINEGVSKIMSGRLITWLGFISYPLYLIHQNLVTGVAIEFYSLNSQLWTWLYPLIPMLAVFGIAHFVAKMEPLVRSLLVKRLNVFSALKFS